MITLEDIYAAEKRISTYLNPTPLLYSHLLEQKLNKKIWLKLESQLPTGSFKARPAFNNILMHEKEAKKHGVVAFSAGNFAQAVAYAANLLGLSATIVMRENTSPYKIQRTKNLGAEVVLCGNSYEERTETTLGIQKETGKILLEPYNSPETIAGDGTLGLELIKQLGKELDQCTILVPVSGGGLIAGIAFAVKTLNPTCQVIGIQPKANGSLAKSLQAGLCVNVGSFTTIADVLSLPQMGEQPFEIIKKWVDDVILVEEDEIKTATHYFLEQHKLVVEPSGAVPLAALLSDRVKAEKVICVISGGNINITW